MWCRVIFLCCIFFVCISGQVINNKVSGCQQYNPVLASLTNSFCSPFISNQIFVHNKTATNAQARNDETLFHLSTYILLKKVYDVVSLNCYKRIASVLCQTAFPTCTRVANETGNSFWEAPIYPCKSSCLQSLQECADFLPWIPGGFLNCSQQNSEGQDQWPIGPIYSTRVESTFVNVSCNALLFPANASAVYSNPSVASCPNLLAIHSKPSDNDSLCDFPCPDPSYTPKEYDRVNAVLLSFGIISFILLIFLMASYMIDNKKRQFPSRIQIFECISLLGCVIGTIMGGMNPQDTTMCVDATTYSNQSNNSLCGAQGFLIVFFGYGVVVWAFNISLVMFLCIYYEIRPALLVPYEKLLHLWGWGLGAVFTIVSVSVSEMEFVPGGRTYCFLHLEPKYMSIDLILFYIPVTIITFFMLLMFILVQWKLFTFKFLPMDHENVVTPMRIRAQRRIFVYTIAVVIFFCLFVAFRYIFTAQKVENALVGSKTWVTCKVMEGLGFPNSFCSTSTSPYRRSFPEMVLQNFALASVGVWVFLVFGTDLKIYLLWSKVFKYIRKKEWDKLQRFLKYGHVNRAVGAKTSSDVDSSYSKSNPKTSVVPQSVGSGSAGSATLGTSSADSSNISTTPKQLESNLTQDGAEDSK